MLLGFSVELSWSILFRTLWLLHRLAWQGKVTKHGTNFGAAE
jgi:hypothetical protein